MESHTLEVLQQGVWASFTGGWFYDFRQNIFCNTFHLYLWLFLLCFPFILHLYCIPSILVYSLYCGTVGVLFTILKLLNYRLHKMFDTSECVQESAPGEDLPESQRKLPQVLRTKTTMEDEGIELQVLNGNRASDTAFNVSFYEETDDDSIISLELEAASSTIDLKVDVHRKDSSESSEELSGKLVKEIITGGTKEVEGGLLKESRIESQELPHPNMWCKHNQSNNNKSRLKTEEIKGIQDNDFIFSQSDCHIAKFRKESMEKLSDEYKMSQSDCHISNLRQRATEQLEMKNCAGLPSGIPKQFNSRAESIQKKCQKCLYKNLNSEFQVDGNLNAGENNKIFERGNLVSNGSYSILTSNQTSNAEEIKNTGSLELPVRDTENTCSTLEKGLLYWKQHNLGKVKVEKIRLSPNKNLSEKLKFSPESDNHSSDLNRITNGAEVSDLGENGSLVEHYENSVHCNEENSTRIDHSKEKSFLEILEENFDWYGSEYQDENSEKSLRTKSKLKDISKSENGENVENESLEKNKPKSGLKFQIDSDEDSSDNCGSRSPLLCRHESLKKDSCLKSARSYEDNFVKKSPSTCSSQGEHPHCFSKISRALSVDENVVLSKKLDNTSKDLFSAKKNSFSSFILAGNDKDDRVTIKDINEKQKRKRTEDFAKRVGKSIHSRESFLHGNNRLSLPESLNLDDVEDIETRSTSKEQKEKNAHVLSVSGVDWLLKNEKSAQGKETFQSPHDSSSTEVSHNTVPEKEIKNLNTQGAIPKTRMKYSDDESAKNVQRRSLVKKTEILFNVHLDDFDVGNERELSGKKKLKLKRENEIIDEEDLSDSNDAANEETFSQIRKSSFLKETYDSVNSSTTELSSLLPLSSLLSSLHPPSSPLLAAFLASRKEIPAATHLSDTVESTPLQRNNETRQEQQSDNSTSTRNRHKKNKRSSSSRAQRMSRSARVSSLPLAALASVVSTNSGTHIATSHDDTSQGAVHCFQDEKGTWMSYTFDSLGGSTNHLPVPLTGTYRFANDDTYYCNDYYCHNVNFTCCTFGGDIQPYQLDDVSYNCSSKENDVTYRCSTFLQPLLRPPCPNLNDKRDGDVNCLADDGSRENSKSENQSKNSDFQLRGNFNTENESSFSFNSTFVPSNVDVNVARSTFASILRERLLLSGRTSLGTISDSDHNSDYSSNVLSLTEFQSNNNNDSDDNNNNNSNNSNNDNDEVGDDNGINDNNNNIDHGTASNSNNNNSGVGSDTSPGNENGDSFYFEGTTPNIVPLRSPFGLIALDRSRQRSHSLHTPVGPQDIRLFSWGGHHGIEQENERNHIRIAKINWGEDVLNFKRGHFYKLYYTPWNYVKIRFDRLDLMALLDRNLTCFEVFLSLFLSLAVSVCGIVLLNGGFYRDHFAFIFCFVLAGCQYSLLKSVQPDATSPTHGYNRVVIYSRSIYFCVTSLIILLLTENLDEKSNHSFQFYRMQITNSYLLKLIRDGLVNMLLFFPIFFTLGLFPQINTFFLYLLEQIDMHVFGGNAMSSLVGALYCVFRSVVSAAFIYGFAYGALSETKNSQHILFSIFSGLLISLSYHLSRSSSNPNIVWEIVKDHLFQDELQEKNHADNSNGSKISKSQVQKSPSECVKNETGGKREPYRKSGIGNDQNVGLGLSNGIESSDEMMKSIDSQTKSTLSEPFSDCENRIKEGAIKKDNEKEEFIDPLPEKLKETVNARLKNDAIVCSFVAILVFGIHCSTVFTALQPDLNPILWGIAGCSGIILHYIVPELRKHLPWLCLASPVLKSREHGQFEVSRAAKVMWFEETYVILCFLERNLLYPVLVLASLTYDGPRICNKFGVPLGAFVTCICGLKVMRSAFSNTSQQYLIVIFSALLFEFDYYSCSETFLVDYFFMGIIFSKTYEFLLKIQFVVIYIAPWQITWGSAFHAFAQPFSVPHSAMLFVQAAVSAILSAPLNPFLGSAIFLASYVRPIKFWERDYNTKRVDHSNTRLSSHLERNLGSDDNNLNSIFYEHLTRSLQHSLCGDLELGRWGPVFQGDCFVLASDYLNCLVHIVEMGNGLVTFQMRGLEFRGTYCQQREVEAISERVEEDDGCCCCEPGHIPHILSMNAAFSKRWLAWEVAATKYVLEGYSISDNSAASTLQVFDFRKILVTYYIKSIIFYCVRSPKLHDWLNNPTILTALKPLSDTTFVDLDPVFNVNIDQDYDIRAEGITRSSFCNVYLEWIHYCCAKREKPIDSSLDSSVISLCFALSLMGRRTLGTASHNTVSSVEFFLYGLHALFKGDFRITSIRDDWIFADMEFLMKVVAPGIRMSLKLHQDHFMSPEEYDDPEALFDAISSHEKDLVISHEGDPVWRSAVLSGTPSLLALRHVLDDGTDEYKVIMLNKRFLNFRVIKLNRECVRGLWAGQQQELVFLRNRNPERGSIQNAKQVLRNMINSSCDQPIGYPIYVSPLTTSYSDTNKQLTGVIGGPLSLQALKSTAFKIWGRFKERCREGCSSGSAGNVDEGGHSFGNEGVYAMTNINIHSGYGHNTSGSQSMDSSQIQLGSCNRAGSLGRSSQGGRGSLPSFGKPSTTLASLAGLLSSAELPKGECFLRERETSFTFIKERQNREDITKKHDEKDKKKEERDMRKEKDKVSGQVPMDYCDDTKDNEGVYQRVRIIDPNLVFDAINLGRRIDVQWPEEGMRMRGGRSYWKDWLPDVGMEGQVVHRWVPEHRDALKRSNVDKTILLVNIEDKYVPIAEAGVQDLGVEV